MTTPHPEALDAEVLEPAPPDTLLFDLDPIKAIAEKYRRGRARYGEEWVGQRAILEAHDEALDLGAYLFKELEDHDGLDEQLLEELIRQTLNLIQGVRVAISSLEPRG